VVEALISKCDKAMDERTNAPNAFSPYQYHEHTRAEAKKAADAEAKKVPKDEKDVPGRVEEPSAAGREGPAGRDATGSKAKTMRQANDPRVPVAMPKVPVIPSSGSELGKANAGIRRVGTGERGILGAELNGYKMGAMSLNIPSSTVRPGETDGSRTPVQTKPSRAKKRTKEEAKVTDDSADAILNCLKLHCLRTRNHDDAFDFLYGRNQGMALFKHNPLRMQRVNYLLCPTIYSL